MADKLTTKDWEDMNMISEYFDRSRFYFEKYGPNTILLMQCGGFYEVYAHKKKEETYKGALIQEFCDVCKMNMSVKKVKYKEFPKDTVYMAGFRDYSIDKYVNKLVENLFTVVVMIQKEEMQQNANVAKKVRVVEGVYSPGTHIAYETETEQKWSQHLMCIWIQQYKTSFVVGISTINIFTGESHLSEHTVNNRLQTTTFDELDKCISIYRPSEILFICDQENVQNYVYGLQSAFTHVYSTSNKEVENAEKQVYRQHLLSNYFGNDALKQCNEFSQYEIATQCFCFSIHFIEERKKELCKRIQLPQWENNSKMVLLANHTLDQLNIIDNQKTNVLSSVHAWTNKCVTVMGKRLFRNKLTHPVYCEEELQNEYTVMQKWIDDHDIMIDSLRKHLLQVYDIQSLTRKIMVKRIYPTGLYRLYKSIEATEQLLVCFEEMPFMYEYVNIDSYKTVQCQIKTFLEFIERRFHLETCATTNQMSRMESPLLREGVYPELDNMYADFHLKQKQLSTIRQFWERQMSPTSKVGDFVKYNHTEKNAITLQMTKNRCKLLQDKMKNQKEIIQLDNGVEFRWSNVTFSPSSKTNNDIRFPLCDEICKSLGDFHSKVDHLTQEIFATILEEIEMEHMDILETCSHIVAKVDVLLNKCYMAQKYNYTRPVIDTTVEDSYVHAEGLRHILIEQLNTNEVYVTNDILLGGNQCTDGMLIFGTNTGGKTSIMRALGTAIIMAQSGMFVPCTHFMYKPYRAIYSRILNQDNMFKGLSTFSVEMSEMRVILQYADEHSLVLGDELCSGTETVSALSIMMASLQRLHERRATFLFATHFHEIVDFDELHELERLKCFHVGLQYDSQSETLKYDRKLRPGSGSRSYGLEVCESLYMDKAFMEKAYELRRTHFPEYEGSLSHSTTKYNAKKIKGNCEMCGKPSEEIHHLEEQHKAEQNGYIHTFHKNHVANLMALCEKCHLKMHKEEKPISPLTENSAPVKTVKRKIRIAKKT